MLEQFILVLGGMATVVDTAVACGKVFYRRLALKKLMMVFEQKIGYQVMRFIDPFHFMHKHEMNPEFG